MLRVLVQKPLLWGGLKIKTLGINKLLDRKNLNLL